MAHRTLAANHSSPTACRRSWCTVHHVRVGGTHGTGCGCSAWRVQLNQRLLPRNCSWYGSAFSPQISRQTCCTTCTGSCVQPEPIPQLQNLLRNGLIIWTTQNCSAKFATSGKGGTRRDLRTTTAASNMAWAFCSSSVQIAALVYTWS